jgi:hypothetical protein
LSASASTLLVALALAADPRAQLDALNAREAAEQAAARALSEREGSVLEALDEVERGLVSAAAAARETGLERAAAEARLAAQIPIDEKAARGDVVVSNDGDRAALEAKAAGLLADLGAGRLGRKLHNAAAARY